MNMRQFFAVLVLCAITRAVCAGDGIASWYGAECAGRLMANGQPFNPEALSCASWQYPLGTRLRITHGNKSCIVFVTDRGPARRLQRIIDLSEASFKQIADLSVGLIKVTITEIQ